MVENFDSSRFALSINQATVKRSTNKELIELCAELDISRVGLWREQTLDIGIPQTKKLLSDAGVGLTGYYRTAVMTFDDPAERNRAIELNKTIIQETAELGAPQVTAVAGGLAPGSKDLVGAREQLKDSLIELADFAETVGVRVALEPLHPMFCADRSVISTLRQAYDFSRLAPDVIGITVDTYHLWWDPYLREDLLTAGAADAILCYQICDWLLPIPQENLLGRGYVGDGYIDFQTFTKWVFDAGFTGEIEVEIFNQDVWDEDFRKVLTRVKNDFDEFKAGF